MGHSLSGHYITASFIMKLAWISPTKPVMLYFVYILFIIRKGKNIL
nr:hypothetical protein CJLB15_00029 [Campylobacter phage CJLB-15]